MKNYSVLGAGQTGKGILIEMDAGYISPTDRHNEAIMREQKELDYRNPFEFYAVLQKYGVPNRNGRVYPERILKRDVMFCNISEMGKINKSEKSTIGRIPKPPPYHQHHQLAVTYRITEKVKIQPKNRNLDCLYKKMSAGTTKNKIGA